MIGGSFACRYSSPFRILWHHFLMMRSFTFCAFFTYLGDRSAGGVSVSRVWQSGGGRGNRGWTYCFRVPEVMISVMKSTVPLSPSLTHELWNCRMLS